MPPASSSNANRVTVRANAKVNLFLRVHPVLPSGRHPIVSIAASVSLADTVVVERRRGGLFLVSEFDFGCPEEDNLCFRAARAFHEALGRRGDPDILIEVDKQIPERAGLGGGSADAAAVLAGLNRLEGDPLDAATLAAIGGRLGSDVPFCLQGGLAIATGTGEELEPITALPDLALVVLKPPAAVSTAWAYGAFDGFVDKTGDGELTGMLDSLRSGDSRGVASRLLNSLEAVVEANHPTVRKAREKLLAAGALGARMTGSGSAVFGVFADPESAKGAADRLGGDYPAWPCTLRPAGVELETAAEAAA